MAHPSRSASGTGHSQRWIRVTRQATPRRCRRTSRTWLPPYRRVSCRRQVWRRAPDRFARGTGRSRGRKAPCVGGYAAGRGSNSRYTGPRCGLVWATGESGGSGHGAARGDERRQTVERPALPAVPVGPMPRMQQAPAAQSLVANGAPPVRIAQPRPPVSPSTPTAAEASQQLAMISNRAGEHIEYAFNLAERRFVLCGS